MVVVVCYDVATTSKEGRRRLRQVAEICEGHGTRVQYSVFECPLDEPKWLKMRRKLLDAFDPDEDSLRFYFLDERNNRRTEHHGTRKPLDLTGALIF